MNASLGSCQSLACDQIVVSNSSEAICNQAFMRDTNTSQDNVFRSGDGLTYLFFNKNAFRWYCSGDNYANICESGWNNFKHHLRSIPSPDRWYDMVEGQTTIIPMTIASGKSADAQSVEFKCLQTPSPTKSPTHLPTLAPSRSPTNDPTSDAAFYSSGTPTYIENFNSESELEASPNMNPMKILGVVVGSAFIFIVLVLVSLWIRRTIRMKSMQNSTNLEQVVRISQNSPGCPVSTTEKERDDSNSDLYRNSRGGASVTPATPNYNYEDKQIEGETHVDRCTPHIGDV